MNSFFKRTLVGAGLMASATMFSCAFALQAPTFTQNKAPAQATNAEFTMNIGHVAGAEHPVNISLKQFKTNVEQRTGGKLAINIYDSGSLGGELEMLEQMNIGTLESSVIMSGSFWERYDTAANVSLIPFLFDTLEGARKAWNGEFGAKFAKDIIEPNGAYVLSYWESGYRHLSCNEKPINVPADMKGIKFRTSENDMKVQMFKALDSNVVMLPFSELFTALQQGTVSGQENPAANILASSLFEVQKYMSLTGHMYDNCVFGVNKQWFDKLPEDFKVIVKEEAAKARLLDLELSDEAKFIAKLKEKGMIINEVDKEAFRKQIKPIWDKFTKEHGPEWIELAIKSQK
ncbi:TRAP-type mannitol/chloroaromatic compound transport system, periplasmic component [Anaerobiospirillum thomasii]|uniref:TRAP-type mannitol/chloroaromatic compound transport system, periplasmic component n=1 Tax=Anaerobiospirillum thomasii TaxID=179995 RepID=A0A2X0VHI5_9GAMM|nr:DctP family TRAP transporter solute-binding subunit [Anaerobiospirillum thomasii]SPT68928.1 TRAP-type mannitol/chloroaromatic compound transport system, periplasmic component [Anaerobiospirillum thomasii]SPT71164.1 TRAP-type mannitol/chloroaromatic compound transport system, periplasmic component [Anaerobiospirillum thomasii]